MRIAQEAAARKEAGEADMNRAHGGDKSRAKKATTPRSRSPTSALNDVGMPSLVQKAWAQLTEFEVNFYENHTYPVVDKEYNPSEQQFPGWVFKEEKTEWSKVDRHMTSEYEEMLDEAEGTSEVHRPNPNSNPSPSPNPNPNPNPNPSPNPNPNPNQGARRLLDVHYVGTKADAAHPDQAGGHALRAPQRGRRGRAAAY